MRLIIKQIVILLDVYKNNSNPMWKKYTNLLNSLDKLYKVYFFLNINFYKKNILLLRDDFT